MTAEQLINAVNQFNKGEEVVLNGVAYKQGEPFQSYEFNMIMRKVAKQSKIESITVPLMNHQDYIGNKDLDAQYHKGFTVGKGKVMYFSFTWHTTGSCTVYPIESKNWPRHLRGDEMITIYFQQ